MSKRDATRGIPRENIKCYVLETPHDIYKHVARKIANLIETKQSLGEKTVLVLPTGSTPVGVYQELIRLHREESLDFSQVITFNLDEYYPIHHNALQSYHRFMHENFFDHVNIPPKNIHIPDGELPRDKIAEFCRSYESKISEFGGIDLSLLGIGRDGHIGFNEPGSRRDSRTRLVVLDEVTMNDAASEFFGKENVKTEAITMGVQTILSAREVLLLATGENKSHIVQQTVENGVTSDRPASFLQEHAHASFYVDRAAADYLARIQMPWVQTTTCRWDKELAKKAVIYLSKAVGKPILELDVKDFQSHYLHDLVDVYDGNTDELCRRVFSDINDRIRIASPILSHRKVLVFSPHPDDDVICMGGTLRQLYQAGCDITVAYMTNGSVSVHDYDVKRHVRFTRMCARQLFGENVDVDVDQISDSEKEVFRLLDTKEPGSADPEVVQTLKGRIRYAEAIAAIEVFGLDASAAKFLDLPFYQTGKVKKNPLSQADIDIVYDLISQVEPEHIFVAGDLTDPHGTHRMCYHAVRAALDKLHNGEPLKEPNIWLYRGAWQEWPIESIDCFVPLTRKEMDEKIMSIFKHQSQKDRAAFPGNDSREFWQRARDRNVKTANQLKQLGLPSFYSVEAFVRCCEMPF
eukprot:gb/GECH01010403.1/.p1 GENE.gb/GECH01010403.1/~~gb/GECH01010403.1/.p1  ORF type:complete len:635 (+),score=154.96 gb/GECH01010403.1/:1-1905(+)